MEEIRESKYLEREDIVLIPDEYREELIKKIEEGGYKVNDEDQVCIVIIRGGR